jgi:hypothetical protein
MFRRSLFLGLTLMLAAVLVYLVIQGKRQEKVKQSTPHPVEIVRESTPSLTRVLSPEGLAIVESKMELVAGNPQADPAEPAGITATHRFLLRNSGRAAYHSVGLKLTYFGRGNKVLETRIVPAVEPMQPGQERSISELKVEHVPSGSVRCEAKIAYADLEPAPTQP